MERSDIGQGGTFRNISLIYKARITSFICSKKHIISYIQED